MTSYMEDNLDKTLGEILPIIQESIGRRSTYFGLRAIKSPMDVWVYQEIIFETKPDVIIEIGNFYGGGALMLAHLCDLIGKGRVIGLDLSHKDLSETVTAHPRITFIDGDACESFEKVERLISKDERVLVIEDSAHTYANTLNVLRLYSKLIKLGDYIIVEDSICHHGLNEGPKPGPYEAIEAFCSENTDFESDRSRERFIMTWNPKGYLRRTKLNSMHSSVKHGMIATKASAKEIISLFIPPILIKVLKKLVS